MSNHSFIPITCSALQEIHSGCNIRDIIMYWRTFKAVKIKTQTIKAVSCSGTFKLPV